MLQSNYFTDVMGMVHDILALFTCIYIEIARQHEACLSVIVSLIAEPTA